MLERLQKILSAAGIASRRKSEELILQHRVKVNGAVATLGQKADYGKDTITVDGNRINIEKKKYLLLYKPAGFVTTTADRFAKRKVVDLVSLPERVYPVGRLDADAEGLLVLTNDGDFANKLMHPRYEVEKTYLVKLKRKLTPEDAERIGRGVFVEGRRVAARIKLLQKDVAEVIVHEGRHKIVKRLFKEVGNYVLRIIRTKIGAIGIGKLKPGMWRELTSEEISLLTSVVKLSPARSLRKGP
ncbi:MAG TPA: pseudouridine synthase [Candidatus Nanoarchaeia archaeon]|nr:pseudouridine synthase [Candidatus Nanoarchaeia archaeon]